MTQKELTCRGLEGWRHGVQRHVGRTKYYRTTPANSSPKFRWLNGKAPQGQHDGRTGVQFQKMRLHPPHPGLNWAITDKRLSYIPNRWSLSSQPYLQRRPVDSSRMLRAWARGSCHRPAQRFLVLAESRLESARNPIVLVYLLQNWESLRIAQADQSIARSCCQIIVVRFEGLTGRLSDQLKRPGLVAPNSSQQSQRCCPYLIFVSCYGVAKGHVERPLVP